MPESGPSGDGSGSQERGEPRKKILVLGASGFIGRRTVRMLAASDWARPVAVTHRTSLGLPIPVETIRLDARESVTLREAVAGAAGVVNCITGDAETIVTSARALLDACTSMRPAPRVVHLSTIMVYGTTTGEVDETAALKGDWNAYSRAKMEVEQMAAGLDHVVHLRPGIVYGPQSPIWSDRIGRWLLEHRIGHLGTAGEGCCNLVHVDDVVQAIERGLRMPGVGGEAFNLAVPSPPTWNEYFRRFALALGTTAAPISSTRLLLEQHILALPLKVAEILAARSSWRPPAPIRPWLLRLCGHPLAMKASKAERVLGIEWTPLERGLKESAASVLNPQAPAGNVAA